MKPSSSRHGFTFFEFLITVVIVAVISAIAIPNLHNSRKAANESSAIDSLKTISAAQEMYKIRHGVFARNFGDLHLDKALIKKNLYNANATHVLGTSPKNGYHFASNLHYHTHEFMVIAVPSIYGSYGDKTFLMNQSGVIYNVEKNDSSENILKTYQSQDAWNPEKSEWEATKPF